MGRANQLTVRTKECQFLCGKLSYISAVLFTSIPKLVAFLLTLSTILNIEYKTDVGVLVSTNKTVVMI